MTVIDAIKCYGVDVFKNNMLLYQCCKVLLSDTFMEVFVAF